MAATAPGVGVGAFESSFRREQQGAWIALTAWSGALFAHGLASTIAGQTDEDDWRKQDEEERERARLKRAAGARAPWRSAGWALPVTVAPSVVSDGVARVPGVVVAGVF
jgi:hypothetical protein